MTVVPDSNLVRQIVLRTFSELNGSPVDVRSLREMILIDDGKYRGRSYRFSDLMAMWLVKFGVIQVYDEEGRMLRTINLFEEQDSLKRAA
jgi:hypothetical protein